jgi:TonB family protein
VILLGLLLAYDWLKAAQIKTRAVVEVTIDSENKVLEVTIISSTGSPERDEAIVAHAKSLQYETARINGRPVGCKVTIAIGGHPQRVLNEEQD